jgi:hypothetical protein
MTKKLKSSEILISKLHCKQANLKKAVVSREAEREFSDCEAITYLSRKRFEGILKNYA